MHYAIHPTQIIEKENNLFATNSSALIQPIVYGKIAAFKINYIKSDFKDIYNKLENEHLTILEASNQYKILNSIKNVALTLSDTKNSILNDYGKAIWSQIVAPDDTDPATEEMMKRMSV